MADTRRHILLSIREQVNLLRTPDAVSSNGAQWSPQQWWESFTFLFVNESTADHQQHQDDLLFFVRSQHTPSAAGPQVFVRRKGKQLPEDLQLTGKDFSSVDWVQTVLLNLVLHSQYQLTVVACGPETLPFVAEGRTWSPGVISVTRPVYASTTVTAVNLDSSRAKDSNPQPCYPDICFAVDNFDNAFDDLVLEDVNRCYCVVLHALLDQHDAPAEPPPISTQNPAGATGANTTPTDQRHSNSAEQQQQPQQQQQRQAAHQDPRAAAAPPPAQPADAPVTAPACRTSSTNDSSSGAWRIGTHKRTLFAGYVSFQQILDFMGSHGRNGRSLLDGWLKRPQTPVKDKVVMTGPGGMGRCEVAVTKVEHPAGQATSSSSDSGHASSSSSSLSQQRSAAAVPGASDGGAERQDGQGSSPAEQQPQGLLQRGLQRARVVATGVQQALDVLSELQPSSSSSSSSSTMLCALMTLRLPVQFLAQELLSAV